MTFVEYCKLHEYGIVILLAIKELLKISFTKDDKPRITLLDDYVVEDTTKNKNKESNT
jgi:hypothetical protein